MAHVLRAPRLSGTRILRLFAQRVGALIAVLALVFIALDLLPGNGVRTALGRDATDEQVHAREEALGLDRPLPMRFLNWGGGMLRGDFGTTVRGASVNDILGSNFPHTLLLGGAALTVTVALSLLAGAVWVMWPRGAAARILQPVTTMVIAIPEFVMATLFVLVFSLWLGWLPAVTIRAADGSVAPQSLILPIVGLAIPQAGWNAQVARAALTEAATLPHVHAAELDGVGRVHLLIRHVLPFAAPTIAASVATSAGMLLGGALVVEVVFNHPGIGSVLASSVSERDATLVASVVAVAGVAITSALMGADLLRAWSLRGRQ